MQKKSNTLTKADIVKNLMSANNLTQAQADAAFNTIVETIQSALAMGINVELRGFGSLRPKLAPAKTGRNPRTGEIVPVPPQYRIRFKPGQALRAQLHELHGEGETEAVEASER